MPGTRTEIDFKQNIDDLFKMGFWRRYAIGSITLEDVEDPKKLCNKMNEMIQAINILMNSFGKYDAAYEGLHSILADQDRKLYLEEAGKQYEKDHPRK